VGWQVVICRVASAAAVRKNMVGVPSAADAASANVASAASLGEDDSALRRRESLSSRISGSEAPLAMATDKP